MAFPPVEALPQWQPLEGGLSVPTPSGTPVRCWRCGATLLSSNPHWLYADKNGRTLAERGNRGFVCPNSPWCFGVGVQPQGKTPLIIVCELAGLKLEELRVSLPFERFHTRLASQLKGCARLAKAPLPPYAIQSSAGGTSYAVFTLEHYDAVLHVLGQDPSVLVRRVPDAVVAFARSLAAGGLTPLDEVEAAYARLPKALRRILLPFQVAGVKFGLQRAGRVLIADEMGTGQAHTQEIVMCLRPGKTVQALAVAAAYRSDWPLLIVVPASLRLPWAEEVERWLPFLAPSDIRVVFSSADKLMSPMERPSAILLSCVSYCCAQAVTIISYHMLQQLHRSMGAWTWGTVICDESHTLRTGARARDQNKQTNTAVALLKRAKHAILLSGTPSLNRPFDLYLQVDALQPGLFGQTKQAFARDYCQTMLVPAWDNSASRRGGRGEMAEERALLRGGRPGSGAPARPKVKGCVPQLQAELHQLLRTAVMVRRLKRDVMAELPPIRRTVVRIDTDATVKNQLVPPARGKGQKHRRKDASVPEVAAPPDVVTENSATTNGGSSSPAYLVGMAKLAAACDWLQVALDSASPVGTAGRGSAREAEAGAHSSVQGSFTGSANDTESYGKLVVFAHHVHVMDGLQSLLESFALDRVSRDTARADHTSVAGPDSSSSVSPALAPAPMNKSGSAHKPTEAQSPSPTSPAPELRIGTAHQRRPWDYVRLDGSSAAQDRAPLIHRFMHDSAVRVALVSVTAGGQGVDLTAASAAVFVELPAEIHWLRQAEDRLHRRGQHRSVNMCVRPVAWSQEIMYYLLCADGREDKHWQAFAGKLEEVSSLLNGRHLKETLLVDSIQSHSSRGRARMPVSSRGSSSSSSHGSSSSAGASCASAPSTSFPSASSCGSSVGATTGRTSAHSAGFSVSPSSVPAVGSGLPLLAALTTPILVPQAAASNTVPCSGSVPTSSEPCDCSASSSSSFSLARRESNLPAVSDSDDDDEDAAFWPEQLGVGSISSLSISSSSVSQLASSYGPFLFEVSPHTNRVHIHRSKDGSSRLPLSFKMEDILAVAEAAHELRPLNKALHGGTRPLLPELCPSQLGGKSTATEGAALSPSSTSSRVAASCCLSSDHVQLHAALEQAEQQHRHFLSKLPKLLRRCSPAYSCALSFVREYRSLLPRQQKRLQGVPAQTPLEQELRGKGVGRLPSALSLRRYTPRLELIRPIAVGAHFRTMVLESRSGRRTEYNQQLEASVSPLNLVAAHSAGHPVPPATARGSSQGPLKDRPQCILCGQPYGEPVLPSGVFTAAMQQQQDVARSSSPATVAPPSCFSSPTASASSFPSEDSSSSLSVSGEEHTAQGPAAQKARGGEEEGSNVVTNQSRTDSAGPALDASCKAAELPIATVAGSVIHPAAEGNPISTTSMPVPIPLAALRDLFCSQRCHELYRLQSTSGLRDIVFARDRGVCEECGMDAHGLVQRIKGLTVKQRRAVVLASDPRWAAGKKPFTRPRYKPAVHEERAGRSTSSSSASLRVSSSTFFSTSHGKEKGERDSGDCEDADKENKAATSMTSSAGVQGTQAACEDEAQDSARLTHLIHNPTEGAAWHVDHEFPVFRGGGEAVLGECRTLCVLCHDLITAQQHRDRATEKRRAGQILVEAWRWGSTDARTVNSADDPSPRSSAATGKVLAADTHKAWSRPGLSSGLAVAQESLHTDQPANRTHGFAGSSKKNKSSKRKADKSADHASEQKRQRSTASGASSHNRKAVADKDRQQTLVSLLSQPAGPRRRSQRVERDEELQLALAESLSLYQSLHRDTPLPDDPPSSSAEGPSPSPPILPVFPSSATSDFASPRKMTKRKSKPTTDRLPQQPSAGNPLTSTPKGRKAKSLFSSTCISPLSSPPRRDRGHPSRTPSAAEASAVPRETIAAAAPPALHKSGEVLHEPVPETCDSVSARSIRKARCSSTFEMSASENGLVAENQPENSDCWMSLMNTHDQGETMSVALSLSPASDVNDDPRSESDAEDETPD